MIQRGIDTDNYDGDIPVSHFQRLHDRYAVRFNIIGLEARTPFAQAQRDNCEAAGIVVPFTYKFLYWTDDDLERMRAAAGFGLPVAIDCEAATSWSATRVLERIALAKEVLVREGRYWGIYTGAWWWPGNTADSHLFSGDRLWHAAYPYGPGVLPPESYLPDLNTNVVYGGWGRPTIHQYADACYEDASWHLDMNAMDLNPVEEGETMERWNRTAAWFEDKTAGETPGGAYWRMNAAGDFQLPADAREVLMEVVVESGLVHWYDGESENYAGGVAGALNPVAQIRARLGSDGGINYRCEGGDVHFKRVACLGYFR